MVAHAIMTMAIELAIVHLTPKAECVKLVWIQISYYGVFKMAFLYCNILNIVGHNQWS